MLLLLLLLSMVWVVGSVLWGRNRHNFHTLVQYGAQKDKYCSDSTRQQQRLRRYCIFETTSSFMYRIVGTEENWTVRSGWLI
jgi:hypothetical protein